MRMGCISPRRRASRIAAVMEVPDATTRRALADKATHFPA